MKNHFHFYYCLFCMSLPFVKVFVVTIFLVIVLYCCLLCFFFQYLFVVWVILYLHVVISCCFCYCICVFCSSVVNGINCCSCFYLAVCFYVFLVLFCEFYVLVDKFFSGSKNSKVHYWILWKCCQRHNIYYNFIYFYRLLCLDHIFDIYNTRELGRYTAELGKICAQLLLFQVLDKLFLRILLKSPFHYFFFTLITSVVRILSPNGPDFSLMLSVSKSASTGNI